MNTALRRLLAAALVGALVLLAVYAAERAATQRRDAEQRAQVGEALRGLQQRLGDALHQRLALLRDLRGLQHLPPGERATALAARLGADRFDYAWIAPLGRVDTVWPRAAEARWRGRDLLRDPLRGDWLRAAAARGDALLAVLPRSARGGVTEVGRLEAYLPLYRDAPEDGSPLGVEGDHAGRGDYWGVAVLGFAAAEVLQDAGLLGGSRDLELALRAVGGSAASPEASAALPGGPAGVSAGAPPGAAQRPLFGHRGVFYSDALSAELRVGGLQLQLAALPRQGWRGAAGGRFDWLWRGLPLALCSGLLLWAAQRRGTPRPWLAAGAAALAVALLSGALLWLVADRERESRRQQLRRDVELGQSVLDAQLAADRQRLRLLAARRPAHAALDAQWREGAQRLLAQRAELLALELWQPGAAAPRRLAGRGPEGVSAQDTRSALRLALATAAARRALLAGRAHYRLDAGGELQLWLPLPAATDWRGAGGGRAQVLGLRYAMPALLAEVLPPNLRRRYHVQVVNAGGERLAALARTGEVDPELLQQTALAPLDYAVALRLGRYRAATLSAAEGFYLGAALLLALALFGALWQLQRRQRALRLRLAGRTRRQLAGNRELREDIRQRERAEAALRESESRYRAVFECTCEAILIVDPRRDCIVDANPTACALLDYPRDELLATPVSTVHPGELPALRRFLDEARRSGAARSAEFSCLTRGGLWVPVELSAAPIECAGDACLLIVARDQRERLASEAELRGAMDEIAALKERVEAENLHLREEIRSERHFGEIVCHSEPMLALLRQLEQVAPSDATVLLLGESGTGKELLARALHGASGRAERALVKVNCAALPENLIESELFGHERGAFSGAVARRTGRFELADGGSLFLDEIGELPLALQAKLLRALQEGEFERLGGSVTLAVDVRIIAATNRDLARMVVAGEFREDLYYRLNVFPLRCPPLRERREDIPLLVEHFAACHAARAGRRIEQIPQPVMARLVAYDWPGNVRELENVIERAVVLGDDAVLRIDEGFASAPPAAQAADEDAAQPTLAEVEARMIRAALRDSGGVIEGGEGAARRLGLAPSTFRERMKKHRIERREAAFSSAEQGRS